MKQMMSKPRHAVQLAMATVLASSLMGCGLIQDSLGLTPAPGRLGLQLEAPSGVQVVVNLTGPDYADTFTDDGTGFATALSLKPGLYTISAEAVPGFNAQVSVAQKNGNVTRIGSQSVSVISEGTASARVSYIALKP